MLKVRIRKTCALLRDNVELLLPTWFGSLVWNRNSQILGRPRMNPQQVKIDFNQSPVYEGGATFLVLLACPANGRSENRNAGFTHPFAAGHFGLTTCLIRKMRHALQ